MATILRSSKYIRCLNIFARRIVVANDNGAFVKRSLELRAQCANSYLTKSYATIPAIRHNESVPNFDRDFAKLDENIQRYGRVFKPEIEAVLSKIRHSGNITSLDALLLIRCCGDLLVDTMPEDRNKLVEDIWNTLDTLKIPIDVSHFNALLRVYLENNREFSPIEFLTLMRDKGVEPNRITYQRLMLYHCKKGDIDGATKILEFMREKEIPLNEAVFNALIIGHSEANDMESAKNVMNVMKEAGVEPCSSTYTALLTAYAKRGDMESIKRTLAEFSTKNLYLQDMDYFDVVQALAANNHVDAVDDMLALMPKGPSYNTNAAHAILKILDNGNVDAAIKILTTMKRRKRADDDRTAENENGSFLIRKLVNSKYPVERIVDACEKLHRQGEHMRSFSLAIERSLLNADIGLSMPLLEAWSKNGGEIREHYFWPLLTVHGRASNYQGILDVIGAMSENFKLRPSMETIKDYVLPYTVGKWDDVVESLRQLRVPHETVVTAIASRMLVDHKIRKTATFMMNYPSRYLAKSFYRPLADALRATSDTKSYVLILRLLCDQSGNETEKTENQDPRSTPTMNIVDEALTILLDYIPIERYAIIEKVLEHLVETGLSISPQMGNEIRTYLADNVNPLTDERIEKLTSGALTLVPISELNLSTDPENSANVDGSEREMRVERQPIFGVKRRELASAMQNNDIAAVQNLLQELEALGFNFSPAVYAQLIDVFCTAGDLESAEKWLKKFKSESPEVIIDLQKATKFAALLIKNDRFDDAVKFIIESPRKVNPETHGSGFRSLVRSLLDVAAETGNVEKTNELFDALLKSKYLIVDNYMLGPLVKVHLARQDLTSALAAFENACLQHRCTPMKNELSKKFIDTEDANSLQRLTDLSTQIHGESNSLIDLVLAFVECGRLRQARKILETPGLRLRGRKLQTTIERYVDDDSNDFLEQFTDITKGLQVIDRREFYDTLIEAYNKKNNWQRGLSLWTMLQDEDLQPSDSFLRVLAELLKRNDQPVPFTCSNRIDITTDETNDVPTDNHNIADAYRALEEKDLIKAENILRGVSPENPEFTTIISSLIIAYIKQGDLDKARELAELTILKHGRIPRAHALKAIWNGFIESGEFEKLRKHGNVLSTNIKKKWRFHKYLIRVEVKESGLKKFLSDFEAKLTDSKSDNFHAVQDGLHFTTLIKEFKKDPSAVEHFHSLAEKLVEQDIYSPINLTWCYYFEKNRPEADAIWSKYLTNTDHVMFKYILQESQKENNVELAERLYHKLLTNTALTENTKVYLLTSLIELYNKNGRIEDALKIVETVSPSTMKMWSKIHPIAVKNFEDGLKAIGKTLPLRIDDTRPDQQ